MRTIKITHLEGTHFVYTPPKPETFRVSRVSPEHQSGEVMASPSFPLVLWPLDWIEIGDSDDFLDHLIATGQAEVLVHESIPAVAAAEANEGEPHAQ